MVCLKANCLTICGRKVYFCLYRHLENEMCIRDRVQGIDYSAVRVEKARKVNARALAAGRCTVQQASVAELPVEAEHFDEMCIRDSTYWA